MWCQIVKPSPAPDDERGCYYLLPQHCENQSAATVTDCTTWEDKAHHTPQLKHKDHLQLSVWNICAPTITEWPQNTYSQQQQQPLPFALRQTGSPKLQKQRRPCFRLPCLDTHSIWTYSEWRQRRLWHATTTNLDKGKILDLIKAVLPTNTDASMQEARGARASRPCDPCDATIERNQRSTRWTGLWGGCRCEQLKYRPSAKMCTPVCELWRYICGTLLKNGGIGQQHPTTSYHLYDRNQNYWRKWNYRFSAPPCHNWTNKYSR